MPATACPAMLKRNAKNPLASGRARQQAEVIAPPKSVCIKMINTASMVYIMPETTTLLVQLNVFLRLSMNVSTCHTIEPTKKPINSAVVS